MINFYKDNGIGKITFASGLTVDVLGRVSIYVDNTTNTLVFAEDGRDKYWINTAGTLQVNGSNISGTNQQKADLIAPVFALTASGGGSNQLTSDQLAFLVNLKATYEQTS